MTGENLFIIGAGGFGLEVAAYAADILKADHASFSIIGFLDDLKELGQTHAGYPIVGRVTGDVQRNAHYVIALGSPEMRREVAEKYEKNNARFITLIHPRSYVADSAALGAGTIVAPFAFVGPEAEIGEHCLLNVHSCAAHESIMGNFSTLSPYASLHGSASLGAGGFIGAHADVTAGVGIGIGTKVAAGSVVYNDVPSDKLAMGNPARFKSE